MLDNSKKNASMSFLNDPSTHVTPLENKSNIFESRNSKPNYNSQFRTPESNQTYYYKAPLNYPEYMLNPSFNYPQLPAEWTKPNQIQKLHFNNSTNNINPTYK